MSQRIAVRTLAEFVHRRGDLYPAVEGRVSAEEGITAQRLAQADRPASYRREISVELPFAAAGLEFVLGGRVDGCDFATEIPVVEEIKASRADPEIAEQLLGSAHWAQLTLYGALLARENEAVEVWCLRLRYVHPDTGRIRDFERTLGRDALGEFLERTLCDYGEWMVAQRAHALERDRRLGALEFPYPAYRPHQLAMARRVYQAFRDGERLLLEAPTGAGKTMGLLYPGLRALADGHVERLFYLTSRSTGAHAVRRACADLAAAPLPLRRIEIVAKEKVCPVPGMPCSALHCDYARGYFDRVRGAVEALLAEGSMDCDTVLRVAKAHLTCPFELSLDAALWADLIVGDYNYLLDPVVRLQRFADAPGLGLLIDESHQLGPRARDMLSLGFERRSVRLALAESPPAALAKRLRGVDRALLELRRTEALEAERPIAEPVKLLRAMRRVLTELADSTVDLDAFPATRACVFELSRWLRSEAWYEPDAFRYFGAADAREITVRLACLDPSGYLRAVLDGYGPHVRFSGSVTPLDLYASLHGYPDTPSERVGSAFRPEQLAVLVVDDLPVYYRSRARTLDALTDLVAAACATRRGNYLVALPSFEYLGAFLTRFAARHPAVDVRAQTPRMDEAERAAFLAAFDAVGPTRIGIVVLGGIFAESVDFSHAPLFGVFCIGVGQPPVTAEREVTERYYDAALGAGGGRLVAYEQPAMTKALQMAGRLLRGPADRGVICLIDPRFAEPAFQRFFPSHWQPVTVRSRELAGRLQHFWAAGFPARC